MKTRFLDRLIPPISAGIIRVLGVTLRMEVEDKAGLMTTPGYKPCIFAFWHNRILMLPYFFRKYGKHRRVTVMISRSRDGQLITEVAERFNVKTARGSTSKHGQTAYRQLFRGLTQNHSDVAITPDGPRGPRCKVQPGILMLAQQSGYPIIPITYHLSKKIEFNSWDRFQMPLPFSRCKLHIGKPFYIPADAKDLTLYKEDLEKRLGI